jgi:hypothetical protein
MKGGARRNKPAALRSLHGSRERPRHSHEPSFDPLDPAVPAGLSESEAKDWAYYARVLGAGRVVTAGDRDTLRCYVRALAEIRDIETQRAPDYRRELRHWIQIARLCAADLGLTPASRARVATMGIDDHSHSSPLAALQAQARQIRRVK